MGPLIRAIRKHTDNPDYSGILERSLKNRNLFIHKFLRQHQWPMGNDDGYLKAIQHLQEIRESIRDADRLVHRILADQKLAGVIVIEFDPEFGFREMEPPDRHNEKPV